MVIEDDKNLNQGICFALKKEGYQVYTAENLKTADEILQKEPMDLLILDLNLPDGDGIEFCQKLRKSSKQPVIMLTAMDMETDEVRGLESGADDYLTKPFSLAVLKARIANAARHISTAGENQDKEEVAYFLNHVGQVLTKEQILQAVWDVDGNFVDENTLAVNIRRLRKKIETEGEDGIIRTVFGVGYQFGGKLG